MDPSDLIENFDTIAEAPGGVGRVRELVLRLAVQGKLVPQDDLDQPADKLLTDISAAKAALEGRGSIQGQTQRPQPVAAEVPFAIPPSWKWTRLDTISEYIQRGKSPKYAEESDIPVISQKCVQWSGFDISRARSVRPDSLDKYGPERFLKPGDLLWNSTGTRTIGRVNVLPNLSSRFQRIVADSHVTVIRPLLVKSLYAWCFLASPWVQNTIDDISTGTTKQKELGTGTVRDLAFPLPPLAEQTRIIAKVDEVMALCDEFEQKQERRCRVRGALQVSALDALATADTPEELAEAWGRVQTNWSTITSAPESVSLLRSAIVEMGVRGRLTQQIEGDEPAETWLQRVALEVAGRSEKGRKRSSRTAAAEVAPWSLPAGWAWARLPGVGFYGRGKSKHRPRNDPILYRDGKYPFVQTGDVAQANGTIESLLADVRGGRASTKPPVASWDSLHNDRCEYRR